MEDKSWILEVQKHNIYDTKYAFYMDSVMKEKAWKLTANVLDVDDTRWRNKPFLWKQGGKGGRT